MVNQIINSFDLWTTAQAIKTTGRGKSAANQSLHGINKLRELILDLAIRGKLVPQDPADEPAILILKQKGIKPLTWAVSDTEIPFNLPQGWEWCRLGEIGITNIGLTYSPVNISDNGIPVLRSSNIQDGVISLNDLVRVNVNPNEKVIVNLGDLLICARNGSENLVGKCAIIDFLPETTAFGAFMAIFRSEFNHYIKYFIESPVYRRSLKGVSTTTINQITQSNLKNTLIPFPPIAEQNRIVAKVDELMSLCDQLEQQQAESNAAHEQLVESLLETLHHTAGHEELQTAWQRIASNFDHLFTTEHSIDRLKETILQLAVMGKLVPQNPEDEPASELLKKIGREKARLITEGRIKKQPILPEIEESEKLFNLPQGWVWSRLNDAIDVRDGTHDTPNDALGPNTYPLVTSKNFYNGRIHFDEAKQISAADHLEISKRSNVERLDILFSMIGGNIGNQVMVNDDRPFSIKNVALFKYYNRSFTSPYFIKKITEHLALDLQTNASGGAQPFVSLNFLRNVVIALPPINEQLRIVAKVNELFTICDALKARISDSQTTKIRLADAVVEKVLA